MCKDNVGFYCLTFTHALLNKSLTLDCPAGVDLTPTKWLNVD